MFTKIYTLKFPSVNEAKIAVSYLSEEIGGSIAECNIASLSILLDKEGTITLMVRFDTMQEMQVFSSRKSKAMNDLKSSFPIRTTESAAVAVFTFDREATATV